MNRIATRAWGAASILGLAFTLTWSAHLQAQLNFSASEITLGEWPEDILRADMDGDGRHDIIVPQWSSDTGRELLIYLQQGNGRFPSEPSRHVEIKPEIIAIAIADVRADPGAELLLFSGTDVFSLSSAIASYTGNLKPLFQWELIASVPDRRRVLYFPDIRDMDGDGHVDLLLPGREGYGYFRGGPDESFTLAHTFSTVNEELDPSAIPIGGARFDTNVAINQREGIVLSVRAISNSPFANFVTDWNDVEQTSLLDIRHFLPSAITTRLNKDDSDDIIFMNIGNDLYGQVNVLLQNSDGSYPDKPNWQGPIDTRGDIRLMDVNGDGLSDLLRIVDNSNDWDVHFFLNREGQFNLMQPDQVMRFSGYDLTLSVTDLNNDGRPQLSASYYTIPVVNAVRNASIVRSQLLFASSSQTNQLFNARPDFRLDETFSATQVRGLSSQIHLQTDLNGNGRRDALYLTNEGTLAAKSIDANLRFADTPFWQYVPARTVLRFDVEDLNNDGTADMILYHSTSMTILVSTP
ncbi:MAG: VCBS repeat-containing protein [Gammaproteobacteria bacterium]|nr:VCBS repeat-containing protein [Gammaproteobacteria bacterium]MDP2141637.1 VCBS repeat-containing protein [Gammaproteobacteria bacterium]MDP2346358.1 VCBS repeat-containing protein [Gammaproteobacteria bacterium]